MKVKRYESQKKCQKTSTKWKKLNQFKLRIRSRENLLKQRKRRRENTKSSLRNFKDSQMKKLKLKKKLKNKIYNEKKTKNQLRSLKLRKLSQKGHKTSNTMAANLQRRQTIATSNCSIAKLKLDSKARPRSKSILSKNCKSNRTMRSLK